MPETYPASNPPPAKPRSRPGPVRWAIAIVLLALAAWAGWHTFKVFGQRSIVRHIDDLGGMVAYDFEASDPESREARERGQSFIATLLGNDYAHDVVEINLSTIEQDSLTDEDLQKVSQLSSARVLAISKGSEITDEGLAALAGMPKLRRLSLNGLPKVTDAGLAVLAKFPELRELKLNSLPKITDEGLKHASQLSALKHLTINNCPINGSGWQYLPAKSLTYLDGNSCDVNDAAIEHLAKATELDEISLAQNEIRGAGLANLKGLANLTKLRLGENPLDPAAAVAAIKQISSLELLTLGATPIGRAEGEELSKALPKCDIIINNGSYDPEEGKWTFEGEAQQ